MANASSGIDASRRTLLSYFTSLFSSYLCSPSLFSFSHPYILFSFFFLQLPSESSGYQKLCTGDAGHCTINIRRSFVPAFVTKINTLQFKMLTGLGKMKE